MKRDIDHAQLRADQLHDLALERYRDMGAGLEQGDTTAANSMLDQFAEMKGGQVFADLLRTARTCDAEVTGNTLKRVLEAAMRAEAKQFAEHVVSQAERAVLRSQAA